MKEQNKPETAKYSSIYANGERCVICKLNADRKIGEIILDDNRNPIQHELTAYVCNLCFDQIFKNYSTIRRSILIDANHLLNKIHCEKIEKRIAQLKFNMQQMGYDAMHYGIMAGTLEELEKLLQDFKP